MEAGFWRRVALTKQEHEREYRVVDQMISMHADIAQRKRSQALFLSIGILFLSAIVCGFTFADESGLGSLGFSPDRAQVLIRLAALTVFGLSIVELRVDWSGMARTHADAARRLSLLKAKYRRAQTFHGQDEQAFLEGLSKEYADTLSSTIEIPERQFPKLKARHYFKRELSKIIDRHPCVPVPVLAFSLRIRATWCYLWHKPSGEVRDERVR